jgi:hypothetical protein
VEDCIVDWKRGTIPGGNGRDKACLVPTRDTEMISRFNDDRGRENDLHSIVNNGIS